jgi:hypothetical protein
MRADANRPRAGDSDQAAGHHGEPPCESGTVAHDSSSPVNSAVPNRIVVITLLAGLLSCRSSAPPREAAAPPDTTRQVQGLALSPPQEKPAFTLTDTQGKPFDFRKETDGYVTLLFFGYTHCPDVCPVHMSNIAQTLKNMPAPDASRIKVVFVTTIRIATMPAPAQLARCLRSDLHRAPWNSGRSIGRRNGGAHPAGGKGHHGGCWRRRVPRWPRGVRVCLYPR